MFKENLPLNCPPPSAIEKELVLFRIFENETLSEKEFVPYIKLFPDNKRYQKLCDAYGISFYTTFDQALQTYKKALEKNNKIGNYIAELIIKVEYGKMKIAEYSGHCNLWLYDGVEIIKIEALKIVAIE